MAITKDRQQAIDDLQKGVKRYVREEKKRITDEVTFLRAVLKSRGVSSLQDTTLVRLSKKFDRSVKSLLGVEVK